MIAWARQPELRDEARRVLRLAVPAVAQSLLQTLVFLVDRLMLGRHSETALASMQAAGPLLWTLSSAFGAFSIGTLAVVGRSIGARDPASATGALRGSLVVALALGLAVGGAGRALLVPMVSLVAGNAGPAVEAAARGYLGVLLPVLPVLFVAVACTTTLQAAGDTRTPLLIALATNVVNVVANWFLIFGHGGAPRLGATGAALANAGALALEALLGLWVLSRRSSPVALWRAGPDAVSWRTGARRVLAVSWGAFAERAVYHSGYLAFVRMTNALGATAMAAHQALLSIESVSFLSADGHAVAASTRVSQGLGAGDAAGARRAGWLAAGLAALLLSLFALVFLVCPGPLIAAFRADPAIVHLGSPALRLAAAAQVPMALTIVLAQALRGAGATRTALAITFVGAVGVRLAATWFCVGVLGLGLTGVWLGSTCDWVVRAAVFAWHWRAGRWARAQV